MNGETSTYLAARESGRALLEPGLALKAALSNAAEEVAQEDRQRLLAIRECEVAYRQALGRLERANAELDTARSRLRPAEASCERNPARFSRRRGFLYLLAAACVLGADAAFLTQVLSSVLQLPPAVLGPDRQPLGPLGALFTFDLAYIGPFSELYLATLGVIALAVPFKAFMDGMARRTDEEQSPFGLSKIFSPGGWVLVLVVLTLVAISVSRLWLDFGQFGDGKISPAEERFARAVAMFIGLACPFAGAFLFMKGLDPVSAARALSKARKEVEKVSEQQAQANTEHDTQQRRLAAARASRDEYAAGARSTASRAQVVDEFRRGYAAGLQEAITSAQQPGAHRRVRELLASASWASFSPRPQRLLPPGSHA